jgi:nucleotide-binding universal stress UspA family protein
MKSRAAIGRILLATDFSPSAGGAEEYALWMASSWHADLTAVTVLEFPPGMDPDYAVNRQYLTARMTEASDLLAKYKQRAGQRHIDISTRIETGLPSEKVTALAFAEECDLIVLGTRGKSGLVHVLLGSTAERVIRTAPCPVLAVHGGEADGCTLPKPPSLERILVPVDFSDCSVEAVEYAAVMAKHANASVELFHVLEPVVYGLDFTLNDTGDYERKRDRTRKRLEEISGALSAAGIANTIRLCGGGPRDSILDESRRISSDLMVMGTHGRRGFSHAISGSVVESVLRHARCPVLTVRSPKFRSDHRRIVPTAAMHGVDPAEAGRS